MSIKKDAEHPYFLLEFSLILKFFKEKLEKEDPEKYFVELFKQNETEINRVLYIYFSNYRPNYPDLIQGDWKWSRLYCQ